MSIQPITAATHGDLKYKASDTISAIKSKLQYPISPGNADPIAIYMIGSQIHSAMIGTHRRMKHTRNRILTMASPPCPDEGSYRQMARSRPVSASTAQLSILGHLQLAVQRYIAPDCKQ